MKRIFDGRVTLKVTPYYGYNGRNERAKKTALNEDRYGIGLKKE